MMVHDPIMLRPMVKVLLCVALCSCVGPPRGRMPAPRISPQSQVNQSQCFAELKRLPVRYTLVPDQSAAPGCTLSSTLQLTNVGIPISNIRAIQCSLARALSLWVQGALQPAAREILGSAVVRIESMGAYACRNIIGGSGSGLSQHATGNAVDVGAFILADGRRISIRDGWNGADDARAFLRSIRASACKRFVTVLSPEYNAAHFDHLHFDMGGKPFCR